MNDLYLIAHKVRGEPAFDIAGQIECSVCKGVGCAGRRPEDTYEGPSCDACEGEGYWWIIPTSGHRAYPWQFWSLNQLIIDVDGPWLVDEVFSMPTDLRDHYFVSRETPSSGSASPKKVTEIDLADLGL